MKILKKIYEKVTGKTAPYYYDYSLGTIIKKPIRKWLVNSIAPDCPFNCIRIAIYRLCGFKIGKRTFIGMKCYLDDMCYDCITIGSDVAVSYGVYFACHGAKQEHTHITICNGAYIGMTARILSGKHGVIIGEHAVVGASTLVNKSIPAGKTAVGIPCRILEE